MPLIVVGPGSTAAGMYRQTLLSAIQRLNLALLFNAQHDSVFGGLVYSPTTSTTFSAKCGSLLTLNVRARCGFNPAAFHTRCTRFELSSRCFASVRVLQCVALGGLV